MNKIGEWLLMHPEITGAIFSAGAAWCAWNAFHGGRTVQKFHAFAAEIRNEALGG